MNTLLSHENMERAVHFVSNDAYTLIYILDAQVTSEKNGKTRLHQVSSFVLSQFKRKTIKWTSDGSQCNSSEEESIDKSKSADDSSTESSDESSIREELLR